MDISQFEEPNKHPYGMLEGYKHATEKEQVLVFMLSKCLEAGKFIPVKINHYHPTMVEDGLLEEKGDRLYKLTSKSISLLYSVYGKKND